MAKGITAEKIRSGLRHAVVYPNVTARTKKRIVQSKRVRAGSLAIVDYKPKVARTCILGVDVVLSFSGVTFVSLSFRFRIFYFYERPMPFVHSFFEMHAPRQPHEAT